MKLLLCIAFAALFAGYEAAELEYQENEVDLRGLFEDTINSTIQDILNGLPETIVVEKVEISLPDDSELPIRGGANLSDLRIFGIKGFQVQELKVEVIGFKLSFTFALPSIHVNTNYWGDITLLELIPFYGSGKANVDFSDLVIKGSGKANMTGGISVSDINVQISLGDAVFDVHGMLDNEEFSLLVSSILNDVVAQFINEHQDFITRVLSPIIEVLINAVLNPGTPETTVDPTSAPSTVVPTTVVPTTVVPSTAPTTESNTEPNTEPNTDPNTEPTEIPEEFAV